MQQMVVEFNGLLPGGSFHLPSQAFTLLIRPYP